MQYRLTDPVYRYRVYFTLAVSLFLLSIFKSASPLAKPFSFVVSDGRFYYVYLPSLVLDGDLDFSNQICQHWETDFSAGLLRARTELGYVRNKYPIGVALSVAPGFLAGHATACVLHAVFRSEWVAPDGYSAPYQLLSFVWILMLGVCSLCLTDYLLSNCFAVQPGPTFVATLACWAGSPLLYYMLREPFMAHVVSGFWVNLCLVQLYLLGRKHPAGEVSAGRLFTLTAAFSMALICRPTNIFLAPFFIYVLSRLARSGQFARLVRTAPACIPGLAPLAMQALVWRHMTGHWVFYSYGRMRFDWLHPAAWQTLFSTRHGLFVWSPLLFLGVTGLWWRLVSRVRRPEPFVLCALLSLLTLWYFNSAWPTWWFGDAFGARAFIEATVVFAAGLAFLFERASSLPRPVRLTGWGLLAAGVLGELTLAGLYARGLISHDGYLF
jgi:hypothetical protein